MKSIKFLVVIIAILTSNNSNAQKGKRIDKNRVKSHKIAFITDQLNLTVAEAEVFWPIYNAHKKLMSEYIEKEINTMEAIVKNPNKLQKPNPFPKNLDNIEESKAKKIYNMVTDIRNKTHQEKQRFFTKMTSVLSYKKILKLQMAEREFRKELFRKLKQSRRKQ